MNSFSLRCSVLGLAAAVWPMAAAHGYVPDNRWTTTASGSAGQTGDPVALTWSLVRDGTSIPDESASNLISFFDGRFGAGAGGSDLTQRPWFHLFQDSFDRWSQLGGVTYIYEPNDSGSALSGDSGSRGVRGDIRIGGANIDGAGGTLAYTYMPNDGDMVIDTGEGSFFSTSSNNNRAFRDTLMHELGHAFGLSHVESNTENFLMEPFIDTSIDGPQLDDIRGIQGLYGDALEKTFGGLGNDVVGHATSLGALATGGHLSIGSAARGSQAVAPTETDFVSIANVVDADYFSFSLASPATVDFTLTPLGGVFTQGVQNGVQSSFNANSRNNLNFTVFGSDGTTQLGSANSAAAGQTEALGGLELAAPGEYFVRVAGVTDSVQMYELALSAASLIVAPSGDFDNDGDFDGDDFLAWQRSLGNAGPGLAADGNHDGVVDGADLAIWQQAIEGKSSPTVPSVSSIPEPAAWQLGAASLIGAGLSVARSRLQRKPRRATHLAASNANESMYPQGFVTFP